ncbi:MAG: hypothetical protein C5B50_27415, partial [Verrucomicrobia bacterium]
MNDEFNPQDGPLRKRDEDPIMGHPPDEPYLRPANGHHHHRTNGHAPKSRVDIWAVIDLLLRRWHLLALCTIVGAGGFFTLGARYVAAKFTATAKLIRYETPGTALLKTETPIAPDTFAAMLRAPDLLRRVGEKLNPPVGEDRLGKAIKIEPEPDSDILNVTLVGRTAEEAVGVLDLYSREAVQYMSEWQAAQAGKMANDYLKAQVEQMDADLTVLERQFRGLPPAERKSMTNSINAVSTNLNALNSHLAASSGPNLMQAKLEENLMTAITRLNELSAKWTTNHPEVKNAQADVDNLQAQIAAAATNRQPFLALGKIAPMSAANVFNPDREIVQIKLRSLEDGRLQLAGRQREAEQFAKDPPGVVRVLAPPSLKAVKQNYRDLKIGFLSAFGGLLGLGGSILLVLLVEFTDSRLKTTDDITRVTKLPVLATLGDLQRMTPAARAQWAFRAWTMLQGRLSPTANHGLICGITSANPGEGRSTWVSLLAQAASLTGFRVLTIATQPSPTHLEGELEDAPDGPPPDDPEQLFGGDGSLALATNVLSSPAQITDRLMSPDAQPVVHIPLPGWVWNLERRKQWRDALSHWRKVDNLVILVELPPAGVTEAVLLGCNLPNMVWLTDSCSSRASDTRARLETLRDARCNLVGAVLNHETAPTVRRRLSRWIECVAFLACLGLSSAIAAQQNTNAAGFAELPPGFLYPSPPINPPAKIKPVVSSSSSSSSSSSKSVASSAQISPGQAQEQQPLAPTGAADSSRPPSDSAASADEAVRTPDRADEAVRTPGRRYFSVVDPAQRAEWQKHLTLGPGDVLTIGLFGEVDSLRADMAIAPDGRINYLEATNIVATGLSIDELRTELDKALSNWRRNPRTMITPVAFHSKRYYMLGAVMAKGVYTLDRPLTVLEAVARAKGMENGLIDRNVVDLADYSHSFLARGGKRYSLNFDKLFGQGDLAQNLPIEPGDYIYFATGNVQEVYVVGEVRLPGSVPFVPNMTIIQAITARGG